MTCDIGSTLNGACDWTFNSTILGIIFSSPLWISVFLTLITIVLIILLYPCKTGTPMYILFRTAVYVFVAIFTAQIIHNGVLKSMFEMKYEDQKTKDLITEVMGPRKNMPISESNVKLPIVSNEFMEQFGQN